MNSSKNRRHFHVLIFSNCNYYKMITVKNSRNLKLELKILFNGMLILAIKHFQQAGVAATCFLSNGHRGVCTQLSECRSAISSQAAGMDPVLCDFQRESVCCADRLNAIKSHRVNDQPGRMSSIFHVEGHGAKNRRRRSPSRGFPRGLFGGYFLPPGLAKKKPWRDDKATDANYYYEYVTKTPFQNSGGRREVHVQDWHGGRQGGNYNNYSNQKGTTKGRWMHESVTSHPDPHFNSPGGTFHGTNMRGTKKPNIWFQETSRPDYIIPSSSPPNSRPQGGRPGSKPAWPGRMRISDIKCQEYSKEITHNITGLPLTTNPDPVIIPVRKCIQAQQLIVGGENTTIGEFPHMAALGFRDRNNQGIAWNCGGTLISEQFILTAAHCVSTSLGRPVKARLGEYNLMKNDDGAYPVDYTITDFITHPEYKPPSKYHDIALLKLSRRVKFYKHIRPACLYSQDALTSPKAIATGWGRINYDGHVSEILQKVVLNIIDNNICNRLYKTNIKSGVLLRGITDTQLCAGELGGGKDTCQGDSGGPLSVTNTKCIHHIIGVTSFGKRCALPNSTGVYTRVSAYVPWIESVVWPSG